MPMELEHHVPTSNPGWLGVPYTLPSAAGNHHPLAERCPMPALSDSGSAITLACPLVLTRTSLPCENLAVFCVHKDVRKVPNAEV